jgi:hypothetical protein
VPTPRTDPEILAAYQGAVSRWCDLTGHVQEARAGTKADAELLAFSRWLDELAAEERRVSALEF